jgi:hypothetical protein
VDEADNVAMVFVGREAGDPPVVIEIFPLSEGTPPVGSTTVAEIQTVGELRAHLLTQVGAAPGDRRRLRLTIDREPVEVDLVNGDPPRLAFADGSQFELGGSFWEPLPPLDVGVALLEPIGHAEYGGVEQLLGVLWEAAASDRLTEGQEAQIRAIAELIDREHRTTTPGEGQRWQLVGAVRAGLFHLTVTAPAAVVNWPKAVEILKGIRWSEIASQLPG